MLMDLCARRSTLWRIVGNEVKTTVEEGLEQCVHQATWHASDVTAQVYLEFHLHAKNCNLSILNIHKVFIAMTKGLNLHRDPWKGCVQMF